MRIDIPVVDHCNLNCKYCCTFSPIAENTFLDEENNIFDLHKLSEITNGKLKDIVLAGGEPLLHPKLINIMEAARKYFTNVEIIILTNGILLSKQSDEFWNACRKNRINIRITHYPISLDIESLKVKALNEAVSLEYWGGSVTPIKSMWKYSFDLDGLQDLKHSWKYCIQANNCIRLKHGKIYPCATIQHMWHFNKFFGTNMTITQEDVLELNSVHSLDEVLTFLSTPKPFCRYCKMKEITTGLKWEISRKDILEWI
jgi:MoaA/NifB/PqqE/SkfB family radical SAM enzyme